MFPPAFGIVIAAVFIIHGIGHGMGILPFRGKKLSESHSADSRILGPLIGDGPSRVVGVVIWGLVMAGFLLAAAGHLGWVVPDHWRQIAAVSAIFSLAGLALFWNAFPFLFPNKVGVILVDAGVLAWVLRGGI